MHRFRSGQDAVPPACWRAICGLGPRSAVALPDSGGVVTFANVRFAIEPGSRFGVALTVIRAEDGLASQVAFFDLIRL